MIKLFYKLIAIIIAVPLWVYYKLGKGGSHREEIAQLLAETHKKIYG
jgi:hypothetical protein